MFGYLQDLLQTVFGYLNELLKEVFGCLQELLQEVFGYLQELLQEVCRVAERIPPSVTSNLVFSINICSNPKSKYIDVTAGSVWLPAGVTAGGVSG